MVLNSFEQTKQEIPLCQTLPNSTVHGMLGALRSKLPSGAPYVDFRDIAEFVAFCNATEARYVRLIERVVDSHMQPRLSKHRFAWTETDEMFVGMAAFPELREHGVRILLGLTRKRGLRFVLALNNSIVTAVTVACRTYSDVHMLNQQSNFCHSGSSEPRTVQYVRDVKTHMVRAFQLAFSTSNIETSSLQELYRRCFATMLHPTTHEGVFIPRHLVPEYALALASITHARLGCGADGAPLTGQRLHEDTLRLIVGFIDFH